MKSYEKFSLQKEQIKNILQGIQINWNYTIYTIWSDWRMENMKRMSPWELILVSDNSEINRQLLDILDKWLHIFNKYTTYNLRNNIELQNSQCNPLFYYFSWEHDKNIQVFFPTRFLDNQIIIDTSGEDENHRNNYIQWLSTLNSRHKKDRKRRISLHKNISKYWENIWKDQIHKHFWDQIHYSKSEWNEIWIKLWPLRYLQYTLMWTVLNIPTEEVHTLFWQSTREKISLLRQHSRLWIQSEEDEKFLIQAYYYFLHIHHMMQRSFIKDKNPISYTFSSNDEKKEFYEILEKFNYIIEHYLESPSSPHQ